MATYVARQPIFDRQGAVYAYELLARSGPESHFVQRAPDHPAGETVINRRMLLSEFERLTSGRKAFVNVHRELLMEDWLLTLPTDKTVIEVLETVRPDTDVLGALKRLRDHGFTIALDDFDDSPTTRPLLDFADILKVDFRSTESPERADIVQRYKDRGLVFLAEKVESRQELESARRAGYELFQGYFFCTPELISSESLPEFQRSHLRLLRRYGDAGFDVDLFEELIEGDSSANHKLLHYLNTGAGGAQRVRSLREGMSVLGEDEVKRWAALVALGGLAGDKPQEIVLTALVRARFAERLADMADMAERQLDLYCLGLFSALDAIVGRPLREVLEELEAPEPVLNALTGRPSRLNTLYYLVLAFERANWSVVGDLCAGLAVEESRVPEVYADSLRWADRVFQE